MFIHFQQPDYKDPNETDNPHLKSYEPATAYLGLMNVGK